MLIWDAIWIGGRSELQIKQENMDSNPGDTLEQLRFLLKREWRDLQQNVVDSIVESMPSRLSAVLKLKGDLTRY